MSRPTTKPLTWFLLLLFTCSAALLFIGGTKTKAHLNSIRQFAGSSEVEKNAPPLSSRLSTDERLLMQGDLTQPTDGLQWKALHLSDPTDPAYYMEYLRHVDTIPEDFEAKRKTLAPENGYFLFWEATRFAKENVKRVSKGRRKNKPEPPSKYTISDPEALQTAVTKIEQALAAPEFKNYLRTMAERRAPLRPESIDSLSNIMNIKHMASTLSFDTGWKTSAYVIAGALQTTESPEEFERLEKITRSLEGKSYHLILNLVDGIFAQAICKVHAESLKLAAQRLNLPEKATLYEEREQRFSEYSDLRKKRHASDFDPLLETKASIIIALTAPARSLTALNSPKFTEEELRPGLRAERAAFSRFMSYLAAIIFSVISLILWLSAKSRKARETFSPHLKILLGGVILPFALCLLFRYILSFGMLNFSGRSMQFLNYLYPDFAVILILMITPFCLIRKTKHRSLPFFKAWWPLIIATLALIFSAVMPHIKQPASLIAALCLLISTLWLLVTEGRTRFGKKDPSNHTPALLAPAYLLAATLMGFSFQGLILEERAWFAHADLEKPTVYNMTLCEEKAVTILKKELKELGGFSDE